MRWMVAAGTSGTRCSAMMGPAPAYRCQNPALSVSIRPGRGSVRATD